MDRKTVARLAGLCAALGALLALYLVATKRRGGVVADPSSGSSGSSSAVAVPAEMGVTDGDG